MSSFSLVVGMVALKKDFYVIVSPNWIAKSIKHRDFMRMFEEKEDCSLKIENVCRNLWGEGTAFKVLSKTVHDFSLQEDKENFKKQMEAYSESCKLLKVDNEINLNEDAEVAMLSMGLPFCTSFDSKILSSDVFVVMTTNDFERILIPYFKAREEEITKLMFKPEKEVIIEVSKMICNCYRLR